MKRRTTLQLLIASGGVAALPTLIWTADAQWRHASQAEEAFQAFRRARRSGRTVLVFLVPEHDNGQGLALSSFLQFGGDTLHAALAHVDVICLRPSELRTISSFGTTLGDGEIAVVTFSGSYTTGTVTRVSLPQRESAPEAGSENDAELRFVDRLVESTERIFVAALQNVQVSGNAATLTTDLAAFEHRYLTQAVPGSRWARVSVCGPPFFENVPREQQYPAPAYDCGMGSLPARSHRFITFYVAGQQR